MLDRQLRFSCCGGDSSWGNALTGFSLRINMESWATFASLRAVRQFLAMVKEVDWRRSSKGRSLHGYCVAGGVPMFFALMWRQQVEAVD